MADVTEHTASHKACQLVNSFAGIKVIFPATTWAFRPMGLTTYAKSEFLSPFILLTLYLPVFLQNLMEKFVSTQSTNSLLVWAVRSITMSTPVHSSPNLCQPNPALIHNLRSILILSPYLIPDHLSSILQLTFSHYFSPACACHNTYPAHLILLHLITLITSGEEYKLSHFSLHHYFSPTLLYGLDHDCAVGTVTH